MNGIRGSDVFLREDLAGILAAMAMTVQAVPPGEFRRGYMAALAAMAVAVHVAPGDVIDLAALAEVER
jgi:hypothetical protein